VHVPSFGLALPVGAAVSVLVLVNLGIAVIATPGNLGTFELATAAALTLWGVSSETALSVGITTHVVEIVPPVLVGLVVSVRSHHDVSAIALSSSPGATGS
jgi:uncharacterized membrane protein YbhN (UPF0104 family)